MAKKKLLQQFILPLTIVFSISLILITWFSFSSLKTFYLEETKKSLLSKSYMIKTQVASLVANSENDFSLLQKVCKQMGDSSQTRITVMLASGIVIADSEEDPSKMDNHNSRKEMQNGLNGNISYSDRYSNTLQRSMMYLAIPLESDGNIIGVLRLSVTTESINTTMNALIIKNAFAVLIVAILATLTGFIISRKISEPLQNLKIGAERFAQGNFDTLLSVPDSEEIAQLAEAMNSMASELDKRIKIITRQRNVQNAILQSMIEGVVAVDKSEKIIIMNSAAGKMFSVDPDQSQDKSLYEVIRNPELQNIIVKSLQSNEQHVGELNLHVKDEKYISYNTSILKGSTGKSKGTLLVLNDLTRLHLLENMKQDLVANVSHELRTPITSIKGFVETLSEGAIDNKEDAKRFLAIIDKQVNRLNTIIEDLLMLSRIEQNKDTHEIAFKDADVFKIINSALEICQNKANSKNIDINVSCDKNLMVKLNDHLMEQAIVNLVDNAIKYSPTGSQIFIKASIHNNFLNLSIQDQGTGIDKKHFKKLFERFYVIDKARSRELGGSGLGLAIVKHIATSNKGTVKVESELGKGSIFTIEIPIIN